MKVDTNNNAHHTHRHGTHDIDPKLLRRFGSIEGQVRGIKRMVEEGKYCIDILTQISAVRAALNKAGMMILRRHIETCVTDAIQKQGTENSDIIDELMNVLHRAEI